MPRDDIALSVNDINRILCIYHLRYGTLTNLRTASADLYLDAYAKQFLLDILDYPIQLSSQQYCNTYLDGAEPRLRESKLLCV